MGQLRVGDPQTSVVHRDPVDPEDVQIEGARAPVDVPDAPVPMLDGRPVSVSKRTKLEECALFVGCGKDEEALRTGLERFRRASLKARKMRMMGSAALGMAYIASGRLDGYIESRISLWDIAAGKLLVEAAGGKVVLEPAKDADAWAIVATNGNIPIEEIL